MNISELSDVQSEAGVVATLIKHPEFVMHSEHLKPKNFYNHENGCMYWAINQLYREGITNIDPYNISTKMKTHPDVSREMENYNIPSIEKFMDLFSEVARNTLEEYMYLVNNVLSLAFKRDMVWTLGKLQNDCFNKSVDLDKLGGIVYDKIDSLVTSYIINTDVKMLGENIDDIWTEIVERRTDDGRFGIPSKFRIFDDWFSFEKGELVMVQAKYKKGKSFLLMNEAWHKAYTLNIPTLYVDTEMSDRLFSERLLALVSGVETMKIKSGRMTDRELMRVQKAIGLIKEVPMIHMYNPNLTDDELYAICKQKQHEVGLGFVVYDYLKANEGDTGTNYNLLGRRCDYLKNKIAGELDMPVLSACQLNDNDRVADSVKINRYISVGIKWDTKTYDMIADDGEECGNAIARVYINRLGKQMDETDEKEYLDFETNYSVASILEAEKQHKVITPF